MDKDTEIMMKRQHDRGLGIEESDLPSVEAKDTVIDQKEVMKLGLSSTWLYDPKVLKLL